MIKPDQIPDEVVEAAARDMYLSRRCEIDPLEWHEIGEWRQTLLRTEARAAIVAALNAWPGAYRSDPALFGHKLIVPLPTEDADDAR